MDLKNKMKQKGYTISKVADILGITQPTLSQQINNKTIALSRLQEIAKIIGVPLSELVADPDAPASPAITCPVCGAVLHLAVETKEEGGI